MVGNWRGASYMVAGRLRCAAASFTYASGCGDGSAATNQDAHAAAHHLANPVSDTGPHNNANAAPHAYANALRRVGAHRNGRFLQPGRRNGLPDLFAAML